MAHPSHQEWHSCECPQTGQKCSWERDNASTDQVHDPGADLGCRILVSWSGCCSRSVREPKADIPCRSLPEAREEGKGSPS